METLQLFMHSTLVFNILMNTKIINHAKRRRQNLEKQTKKCPTKWRISLRVEIYTEKLQMEILEIKKSYI